MKQILIALSLAVATGGAMLFYGSYLIPDAHRVVFVGADAEQAWQVTALHLATALTMFGFWSAGLAIRWNE